MKYLSLSLLFSTALLFAGCATTPAKPRTFDQLGQFSSYALNHQTFRIGFQGSPNMNYGMAEEIALVKAAQTTVQNGFRYFKVLDDPSNRSQQPPRQAVIYPNRPAYYPYGFYRRSPAFWPDPFYDMPQVINIDPVQVSYTIECYKEQKNIPDSAFDARLILSSIGQKYGLDANGQIRPAQPVAAKSGTL